MRSKYGFKDGSDIPSDAQYYRRIYVTLINHFANLLKSNYVAKEFNRPGFHNYCLIMFCQKDSLSEMGSAYDGEMERALHLASDVDIDYYISTNSEEWVLDFISKIEISDAESISDPDMVMMYMRDAGEMFDTLDALL